MSRFFLKTLLLAQITVIKLHVLNMLVIRSPYKCVDNFMAVMTIISHPKLLSRRLLRGKILAVKF